MTASSSTRNPTTNATPKPTTDGPRSSAVPAVLDRVAAALVDALPAARSDEVLPLPRVVGHFVDALHDLLLPTEPLSPHDVREQLRDLRDHLLALTDAAVADRFLESLPDLQRHTRLDVDAAWRGDPAATSHAEVVACYPGVRAITAWRAARELHVEGVAIVPRMITEHVHARTGIDIHPGATIGDGLFIDHGTGVVIGETCVIGHRVRIYQGVTLGARSFPLDDNGNPVKGVPRHPIVGDNVTIYAGATILGRVTIGAGSVIGGNVQVTRDVPPASRVVNRQPAARSVFEAGAGI